MSIKEVTYYQIECDEPNCERCTGDGEFSAWGDAGAALDDWRDGDGVFTEDGRTFCEEHRPPVCVDCDATVDLTEDVPGGELFCPNHIADGRAALS